jgi:hypothetical protein
LEIKNIIKMYLYEPTPMSDYFRYYNNQAGFGYAHPGIATFKGPVYQRGNGIGSIFSSLWSAITPLFRSDTMQKALKTVGQQALHSGMNVGSDLLQGRNLKESLKHRAGEAKSNLMGAAAEELKAMSGSGRRKRRKSRKPTRKAPKRRSSRATSKPRKRKRRASKRKKTPAKKPAKKGRKKKTIFD